MDMPRPTPDHLALERLAGEWIGEEKLHPSPWDPVGGTAAARVTNRMILDGFALAQDYAQERGGGVTYRGHGVLRFDPASGGYVVWWIDSVGTPPGEFRGSLAGDTLALTQQGAMGHARATWKIAADRYDYRMDVSPDGAVWHPFLEGTYRRQG